MKIKISKENKAITIFLIKFILIFGILFFLIEFIDLSFFNNFLAKISAITLGLNYSENIIFIGNTNFIVTNLCSGLVSISIMAGIIFAFKKPILINKIILFLLSASLLLIINVFRIIFVLLAAKLGFDAELIHVVTWFIMSGIILALWFYGNKKLLGYNKLNKLLY